MFKNILFFTVFAIQSLCLAKNASLSFLEYEYINTTTNIGTTNQIFAFTAPKDAKPGEALITVKRMDDQCLEYPVQITDTGLIYQRDTRFSLALNGGYAEKFEVTLSSNEDDKPKPIASCEIVPFPIYKTDGLGRVVQLHAMDSDGLNFMLEGSNFKSKEMLKIRSKSCGEIIDFPLMTDEKGCFKVGLSPAVIGKTQGPFELSISIGGNNAFAFGHFWGKIAFTKTDEYKKLVQMYNP